MRGRGLIIYSTLSAKIRSGDEVTTGKKFPCEYLQSHPLFVYYQVPTRKNNASNVVFAYTVNDQFWHALAEYNQILYIYKIFQEYQNMNLKMLKMK